jgi:quercetin dioxygenase-like cupin family protein
VQATAHWVLGGRQCLSAEAVQWIVNNASEVGGRPTQPQDVVAEHIFPGLTSPLSSPVEALGASEASEVGRTTHLSQSRTEGDGRMDLTGDMPSSEPPVMKINVLEAPSFQLPNQENRLALVLDPLSGRVPFTFGVEMFPEGHETPPHVHDTAHEMFFVLSGSGSAFCNGSSFSLSAGDCVVFPPGSVHGVDADEKMYCLELMLPNEQFAEFVRSGIVQNGYDADDSCILAAIGCW